MLKPQIRFLLVLLCTPLFGIGQAQQFSFQENKGQWPEQVKFRLEGNGAHVYLEKNAFHYQFTSHPDKHKHSEDVEHAEEELIKGHVFRTEFVASNPEVSFELGTKSKAYHNYYLGNDKSKWANHVYSYNQLKYKELYSKIDLLFYKQEGFYKYDYIVKPNGNPQQIKVNYKGVDKPQIIDGNLLISHNLGELIEEKPYAYQVVNGRKIEVACRYIFDSEGLLGFEFPNGFDSNLELVIDPTLIFSTYSGSGSGNFGMTATYDRLGNGYMGGTIFQTGYIATLGAFQQNYNGGVSDVVISKFNEDGSQLIYGTYLGGGSSETVHSMVVDDSLNLIVFGVTGSANFPTSASAYDRIKQISTSINLAGLAENFVSGPDIYITKFNSTGTQIKGSTFFGGDDADGLNINKQQLNSNNTQLIYNYGDQFRGEVIVDSSGNIFIGTVTYSTGLGSGSDNLNGIQDGIVAKFSPNLDNLIWSKYVGGSQYDAIYSLKIMSNGNILIGGGTTSGSDFPVTNNVYQTNYGGNKDGFIAIISSDGQNILKATYVGQPNYDQIYFIEFDRFGGIYALGQSIGGLIPVKNSTIADPLAGQFIMKFDPNLDSLIYSTTFGDGGIGGQINISPTAFLVDQCQNVYASGWGGTLGDGIKSLTNAMYTSPNAFRSTTNNNDFYLYVMSRDVDTVLYASFFGGTHSADHVDGGTSRFDKRGVIYQSVCASCYFTNGIGDPDTLSDFPTTPQAYAPQKNTVQGSNDCNNALFKFDFEILPQAEIIADKLTICAPDVINFRDSSRNAEELIWDFFGTESRTQGLDTNILFTTPGLYTVKQIARDTICNSFDSTFITVEVLPNSLQYNRIPDIITCDTNRVQLNAKTDLTANRFIWSSNPLFSDTLQNTTDSILDVKPTNTVTPYYLRIEHDTSICKLEDTIQVRYLPLFATTSIQEDTICEGSNVQLNSNFVNAQSFIWDFGNGMKDSTNRNPIVNFLNPGDYQIQAIINNQQCKDSDTSVLSLNVRPNLLQIQSIPDTTYCGLDTLSFSINSFGTSNNFLWSYQSNFSDTINNYPLDSNIQIFSNTAGNIYKKITNKYCERTSEVFVQYITYDLVLAAMPDSLCAPANLQLNSRQLGVTSFEFDFGNGNSNSVQTDPTTSYTDSGTYTIRLIGSNQTCPRSDTLYDTIRIEPEVRVFDPLDTLICLGDSIVLKGNSFGTANQFQWSASSDFSNPLNALSDSSILVTPNQAVATYYFKALRTICADSTQKVVRTQDVDVFLDDFTSICVGDTINLQANDNGINLSYLWAPNDSIISGQGSSTITIAPQNSVLYELNAQSSIGCKDFKTSFVEVNQPAFNDADVQASIDTIYSGQLTRLSTNRNGSNLTYVWEPSEHLDDNTAANPNAKPTQTTTYRVVITDHNTGCNVVAYRTIYVFEINCAEPEIFIPTAFSPNNDGVNDILYVRGSYLNTIELEIYNRWGELVFTTTDLNSGWDGTYKGEELNTDVFNYYLKATCFDGQEFFSKGNISLIR